MSELVVSTTKVSSNEFASRRVLRLALAAVSVGAAYYIGAKIGFALTFQPHPVSTLWPPNSILFAALLLSTPRSWWFLLLAAFPDFRMDVEDVIASSDKAVARVRVTGTHKGEFMGIPATEKSAAVNLIDITRFGDDGLAHEHWGVVDQLALLQQLGVILARPPA